MIKVDETVAEMREIVQLLWENEEHTYRKLAECMPGWQKVLQEMLEYMCHLQSQGMEVPLDIIFQQLDNFNVALQKKDDFMLADVLGFEVIETLKYYEGIVERNG